MPHKLLDLELEIGFRGIILGVPLVCRLFIVVIMRLALPLVIAIVVLRRVSIVFELVVSLWVLVWLVLFFNDTSIVRPVPARRPPRDHRI
jgi:hypothetical protein